MKDLISTGYIHQIPSLTPHSQGNGYVGIGLSGKKLVSEGVPFDMIAYILSGVMVQRQFQLDQLYILIADVHAQKNVFTDNEVIDEKAETLEQIIIHIIDSFQLHNCNVLKARDITCHEDYQGKLNEYRKIYTNDYVVRELADIWYFYHRLNTKVKISWKDPKGKLKYDESFFDSKYVEVENAGPEFIYTMPGFDFRKGYNYVSPYTFFSDQSRIHIYPTGEFAEQIQRIKSTSTPAKLAKGEKIYQDQIKVIEAVLREEVPGQNVWDKIQYIGEEVLKI